MTPTIPIALALVLSTTAVAQEMPDIQAETTATFGESPAVTPQDAITDYTYDSGYLGGHIEAPLQSVQTILFPMPPEEVFPLVHSGNADWSLQIETLEWDHSASEAPGELGTGSVRRCDFAGGTGTAYERVLAVEENRLFAYDLDMERSTVPLPVEDFYVIWTLEDKGADGTLVTARIYFDEAQEAGGEAAAAVGQALAVDFRNFANLHDATYVEM